jgi:uncharacterized protein (DUF1697 family)
MNLPSQNLTRRKIERMTFDTMLYKVDQFILQLENMQKIISNIESLYESSNETSNKVNSLRNEIINIKTQLAGSIHYDEDRYGSDTNESET